MTSEPSLARSISLEAEAADAGARLDRWLAAKVPELSRARIQALIRSGHVRSGATISEPRQAVKPGAVYVLDIPPPEAPPIAAEAIALDIVYEDDDVIVIDKPAGLVVHPGAGHDSGTLVNALIAHCGASLSGIGGVKRPGIVHRLDKDTSGLLVVAKTDRAHAGLAEQFKSHGRDGRLSRTYLALVWGTPAPKHGSIEAALTRSAANRKKITVTRGGAGRAAITHYSVIETFDGEDAPGLVSLVQLELETGRTHQIRVHLAHIGHPVVGDPIYAAGHKTRAAKLNAESRRAVAALNRQALHAARLGFEHPTSGRTIAFDSDIPLDIQRVIDALRKPRRGPAKAAAASAGRRSRRRG